MGDPENTIEAFKRAKSEGFHFVELDVHKSLDEQWVVYHDFKIPNGLVIEETPYEEIKENLDYVPPLLEDVLKLDINLNIELKVPKDNKDPRILGKELAKFLKENTELERIYVSRFNYKALLGVCKEVPKIRGAFLCVLPRLKKWDQVNRKLNGLYSINPLFLLLRKKHVDWAHKNGIEIHPWTVNREKWIKRMRKLNVDAIITDKPKLVQELVEVSK